MAYYQSKYPNTGPKGKATRIVCSWCKKLEKVGEEWVRVSAITAEEKIGYRCCPSCDTKKRGERLPGRPRETLDGLQTPVIPATKTALPPLRRT